MPQITHTYNLGKQSEEGFKPFTGCLDHEGKQIVSVTLRTTDGRDEAYASKQAEARGTGVSEELIRLSIVDYRRMPDMGENVKVEQPFINFDSWSTRARNFIVAAWQKLSTPDADELADFFASATVGEQRKP